MCHQYIAIGRRAETVPQISSYEHPQPNYYFFRFMLNEILQLIMKQYETVLNGLCKIYI